MFTLVLARGVGAGVGTFIILVIVVVLVLALSFVVRRLTGRVVVFGSGGTGFTLLAVASFIV